MAELENGSVFVVNADFKAFFDSIPHARLLARVRRKITDRRGLGLIEMMLKTGIMEQGEITEPEAGTPQGGVISPLLANLYLDDLDWMISQAGLQAELGDVFAAKMLGACGT